MNRMAGIKSPLEVVDVGADIVNQAFSTPPRVVGNVSGALSQAAKNIVADLARPREAAEIPPTPDVLIEPAFSGVGHIIEGGMGMVKGAIDGVVESVDGIRREVETFVRR